MTKNTDSLVALPKQIYETVETRKKVGLALRPPRRLLRLLHLAREHAVGVAFRPISFENRIYLCERTREINNLGREINALIPELKPAWQSIAKGVAELLSGMSIKHDQEDFAQIIPACDQTKYRDFWNDAVTYVPANRAPLLQKGYEEIIVVIGPALGLGDEISCFEFVNSFKTAFPGSTFELYSFYPELWRTIESESRVHSMVGRPMVVFDLIDKKIREGKTDGILIVFINFSGLYLHLAFCLERIKPDMVEIAVGKGTMWYSPGKGGFTQVDQAMDSLYPGNGAALRKLAIRLAGDIKPSNTELSSFRVGSKEKIFRLLVNPFTSKQIFLTPQDWAAILKNSLEQNPSRKAVFCMVLPGMTEQSVEYTRHVVAKVKKDRIDRVEIKLMGNGNTLNPNSAFQKVFKYMKTADLIIGIDTYTTHLAAMLSVPSITLCYEHNVAFWPEKATSICIELRHGFKTITSLIAIIHSLTGGLSDRGNQALKEILWSEEFERMDAEFHSDSNEHPGKKNLTILRYGNAVWNKLPPTYQKLIEDLDYNYAWPKINKWLPSLSSDKNSSLWMLNLIRLSHFQKISSMIANLNRA
ncbi:hypothetical protein KA005_10145 [bacterium]|nr:hypothetical protein [bacterium]